jgi:hypothetical protein
MRLLPNRWALAWAALTAAFALHVLDEATHDFLAWYNPNASAIRDLLGEPWFPPSFSFSVWIGGLCAAIALLAALTPMLHRPRRWLIAGAYVYAGIHVLNGLLHLTLSVVGLFLAPGALSSPVLLMAAVWLLIETRRVQKKHSVEIA